MVKAMPAPGAERRQAHHHGDDPEQPLQQHVDQADQRLAAVAEPNHRDAHQHRDQDDLQHGALGEGIDDRRRDDVEEEGDEAVVALGRLDVAGDRRRIDLAGVDVHAGAGLHHAGDHQADQQRQGRDDLEIEQCLGADPPDILDVVHLGDADNDGAEDDRPEQHLDQLDEPVRDRLQRRADLRPGDADPGADDDADQHLDVQFAEKRLPGRSPHPRIPSLDFLADPCRESGHAPPCRPNRRSGEFDDCPGRRRRRCPAPRSTTRRPAPPMPMSGLLIRDRHNRWT
jgi:hypothetical protein